jgi:hypothetical protein
VFDLADEILLSGSGFPEVHTRSRAAPAGSDLIPYGGSFFREKC